MITMAIPSAPRLIGDTVMFIGTQTHAGSSLQREATPS
jgi:hypothetical protein